MNSECMQPRKNFYHKAVARRRMVNVSAANDVRYRADDVFAFHPAESFERIDDRLLRLADDIDAIDVFAWNADLDVNGVEAVGRHCGADVRVTAEAIKWNIAVGNVDPVCVLE